MKFPKPRCWKPTWTENWFTPKAPRIDLRMASSPSMKAVLITHPGGVEALEIGDAPFSGVAGAEDVLVRVRAAGLNRADILQRQGKYPAPPDAPPNIPGLEFAGVVEEAGSDTSWKP